MPQPGSASQGPAGLLTPSAELPPHGPLPHTAMARKPPEAGDSLGQR